MIITAKHMLVARPPMVSWGLAYLNKCGRCACLLPFMAVIHPRLDITSVACRSRLYDIQPRPTRAPNRLIPRSSGDLYPGGIVMVIRMTPTGHIAYQRT